MPSVDNRVVEMEFRHRKFMENSQETLSMLDKLKEKLSFKGAAKGFQELDTASRGIKLDHIGNAVDQISSKFTAFGAVALTVIQRVVNTAITAGTQIVQGLSLKPVLDGFSEYETNLNSIQTILANTKSQGSSLEDVNAALAQLNAYSDKTIYNFGQMARNIGTFTAAGIDLDTSVNAIKGISNLAAISGSNAEQASTAMYQLSQALAAGKVSLMDWNSVVNAGMGGEVFKTALFETAQAMGTLNTTFSGQTFEEWEKAGNNFRESISEGWITTDVLTNTLQAFTGDLTDAQLQQIGYTEEQIARMKELGELGVASATEVKTITQLIGTVKEAIGTGWADSMRIVIGDFEEAKTLWTTINNIIGGAIGRSADARNALLQGWRDLGGREALIQGLGIIFHDLIEVLHEIGDAWRDVFPPVTAQTLFDLTVQVTEFLHSLIPTGKTLNQIGLIFKGFFSILSIGWEIIKNTIDLFRDLFGDFADDSGSGILTFLAELGIKLERLEERLVNAQQITRWFNDLKLSIRNFIDTMESLGVGDVFDRIGDAIDRLKEAISDLFSGTGFDNAVAGSETIADRWSFLATVIAGIGAAIVWVSDKIAQLAGEVSHLFGDVVEGISNSEFDHVTDALNVGILGSIALGFRKFFSTIQQFSPDSLMGKITDTLKEVTDTLEAMQLRLKSEALLNIAFAVGVLTASLFVLASIDSAALTKALTATAAGFAELATTLVVLNKMEIGPRGAAKMALIGTTLILIAGALLVLSLAVKILSTMDPGELAKGMAGVTGMLTALVVAVNQMPSGAKLVSVGFSMIVIAGALVVMALAVKAFGTMDIQEMLRGLVGVGLALTILVVAVKNLPTGNLISAGIGIVAIAGALVILGLAVKIFGSMDLKEMFRGLIGVGIALALIVVAVRSLPTNMAVIGAGLVLVGIGIGVIVAAVAVLGTMPLENMILGLGGLAAALLILAVASNAMNNAIPGAIAIGIMSASIMVLAVALATIAAIGIKGIIVAIVAIAAVFVVFAAATYFLGGTIPAMLALASALITFGIALGLIGAAVFLAGAGIWMLVKAVQALVDLVIDSADGVIMVLDLLIDKTLEFMRGLFDALLDMAKQFIEELPGILAGLGEAFVVMLQEARDALPDFLMLINEVLVGIIATLRERVPEFINLGIELISALLQGIADNIYQITDKVVDIILAFTQALTDRMPEITEQGSQLIVAFITGLSQNVDPIIGAVANLIITIINGLVASHERLVEAGKELVRQLIRGFGEMLETIITEGKNLVINFLVGLGRAGIEIATAVTTLITTILSEIGKNVDNVIQAGKDLAIRIMDGLASNTLSFITQAAALLINFLEDLEQAIRDNDDRIRSAALGVVDALFDGLTNGLSDKIANSGGFLADIGREILDKIKKPWELFSPSRAMYRLGGLLIDGLVLGVNETTKSSSPALSLAGEELMRAFNDAIVGLGKDLEEMDEFNPTITPVLDLTKINSGAKDISDLISSGTLTPTASITHAAVISDVEADKVSISKEASAGPTEIKFEQTINSPEALTTGEIHRDTKSLLVLAKKELDI